MPLYEYECKECGRRTEKIQKFSDAPLTVCPHCGGPIERTLTAPAVQFKGGGWYKDLYSSPKPATSSSGDSGKSGSEASKLAESTSSASTNGSSSSSSTPAASSPPVAPKS
jgi:putative FmdB family regulatory protein